MKITVVNGTEKHGVTYRLKEIFLSGFEGKAKGEQACKDADKIRRIEKSLLEADLIVMTSPAYVFHATGAMKAFLDHLGYRWIPHRPAPEMFRKRAVIITQCLGAGAKSAA